MKNHSITCDDAKLKKGLAACVKNLSDRQKWNWTVVRSADSAADCVLQLMVENGLIEHRFHPSGGNVWRFDGKLYGRKDGITLKAFNKLKQNYWE